MDMPGSLEVAVSFKDARETLVSVTGELDIATAGAMCDQLAALLKADGPANRVIVDVSKLQFVDAAGISAMVAAARTAAEQHRTLVYRRPSKAVRRVLELLQGDAAIPVEDSA